MIELAFISQWAHFGQGPGGTFHDDGDLIWTEGPIAELPYNAVVGTRLDGDGSGRVDEIITHFRSREVQFMWLITPTTEPTDLAGQLARRELKLVEHGTGMSLDLRRWRPAEEGAPGPISYRQVQDDADLEAYEALIARYWDLPKVSCEYVFGINRWAHDLGHGTRFVAYKDSAPIGKAYLSYTIGEDAYMVSEDTAAIFGVYVAPEARGYGVASTLTELLIHAAVATGRRRVVLHSSEMALGLYLRMGFAPRCSLPVYATSSLHSIQPS